MVNVCCSKNYTVESWKLQQHMISIIENPFDVIQGSHLPKKMAAHCQVSISNGKILIYGGITEINENNSNNEHNFEHDNEAYIWANGKWLKVNSSSPCPSSRQPVTILQQCALKGPDLVVIIAQNFNDFTTCTSLLNVTSFEWHQITSTDNKLLPIGGFILTGVDLNSIYYFGGYFASSDSNNKTVFELTNKWTMTTMKLPFAMTGLDSIVIGSQLNLTQCVADVNH